MPRPKIDPNTMTSAPYGPRVGNFNQIAVHYPCSYDCTPSQHTFGLIQHVCALSRKREVSQEELRWTFYKKNAKSEARAVSKRTEVKRSSEDQIDYDEGGKSSPLDFEKEDDLYESDYDGRGRTSSLDVERGDGRYKNENANSSGGLPVKVPQVLDPSGSLQNVSSEVPSQLGDTGKGYKDGSRALAEKKFLLNLTEAEAEGLLEHPVFKEALRLANLQVKREVRADLRAELQSERDDMMKPENIAAACKWTDTEVRTFVSINSDTRRVIEEVVKTDAAKLFEKYKQEYKPDVPAILRTYTTPETIAAACGWSDRQTRDFIANNPTAKKILTDNVKAKVTKMVEEERVKFKELIHTQFEQEVEEQVELRVAKYREEQQSKTKTALVIKGAETREIERDGLMGTQTLAPTPTSHPLFGLGSTTLAQNNLHLAALNARKLESGQVFPTWYSTPIYKRERDVEDVDRDDPTRKRLCGGGSKL